MKKTINEVLSSRVTSSVTIDGIELKLSKLNFGILKQLEDIGIELKDMDSLSFTKALEMCWFLLTKESKELCESKDNFFQLVTLEYSEVLTKALSKSLEQSFPKTEKNEKAPIAKAA